MAAAIMYVTQTGAGGKEGNVWSSAMDLAAWEADMETNAEPGDVYYVEAGTYSLTNNFDCTAKDGTAVAPIEIIGVQSGMTADDQPPAYSKWAFGADRPVIAAAAYAFNVGDYYKIRNLIITTTAVYGFLTENDTTSENCKCTNSSETGSRYAFYGFAYNRCIGDEGICTNGIVFAFFSGTMLYGCYGHDSEIGFNCSGNYTIVINNVFDTLTVGIEYVSYARQVCIGNTFYNCEVSITATDSKNNVFINNIFQDSSAWAVSWTTAQPIDYWDYNCWGEASPSRDNVTPGNNKIDADSLMSDPANANFLLGPNSPCLNTGMDVSTRTALTGSNKCIGAMQRKSFLGMD